MTEQMDSMLTQLDFPTLKAVQVRVQELVQQRREELRTRLQQDAELIDCELHDTNGGPKPRRKRNSKHHEAS